MSLGRRLASQSGIIFAARLVGAGLVFLAQAVIARVWGAEILGEYLLVVAVVNLVALILPLGFHTVGTYFAAEYRARGERRSLIAFLARCYVHVLFILALVLLAGFPLAQMTGAPGRAITEHFIPACLLAFGTAMVYVNGAVLVGLRRPLAGFFADTIFRPLVVVAALVVSMSAASPGEGFSEMLWIVALGYVAVSLVHFGFVVHATLSLPREDEQRAGQPQRWWRFALPWVLISLATDFFFDIDLLLLSNLLSREDLAIFGVCTRVFSLASFGVAAVYAVTLPDMFESEALADRSGFHRKVGDANLVAAGIAVTLFILMAVLGPFALMLFGPAFVAGAIPLAVLCLALVVRSVMGPASMVLSIHDRPWASLPAVALGIVTLVAGNAVLVPALGLLGAALAALVSIVVWNGALWWTALKTAKVDVSLLQRWRRSPALTAAE